MIERCEYDKARSYPKYGGRGIRLCERWRSDYKNFYADVGDKPAPELSIDRVDNDLGYDCGKCEDCACRGVVTPNWRWATRLEQARNKRNTTWLTMNGVTLSAGEWSDRTGLPQPAIYARKVISGWSDEKTLSTPLLSARESSALGVAALRSAR